MALILETGEGSETSNSLVSLEEVRAFATSRGQTLPESDETLEAAVIVAHDYIVAREPQLQGFRRKEDQALPFPRNGLSLYGRTLAVGVIPNTLKSAICQLVIEGQTRDVMPAADGRVVQSEAVGPISTTYAATGSVSASPALPRVDAFLAPLLRSAGTLNSIRV